MQASVRPDFNKQKGKAWKHSSSSKQRMEVSSPTQNLSSFTLKHAQPQCIEQRLGGRYSSFLVQSWLLRHGKTRESASAIFADTPDGGNIPSLEQKISVAAPVEDARAETQSLENAPGEGQKPTSQSEAPTSFKGSMSLKAANSKLQPHTQCPSISI